MYRIFAGIQHVIIAIPAIQFKSAGLIRHKIMAEIETTTPKINDPTAQIIIYSQWFITLDYENLNIFDSTINDTIKHISIDICPIFDSEIFIKYIGITSKDTHIYTERIPPSDLRMVLQEISNYTNVSIEENQINTIIEGITACIQAY